MKIGIITGSVRAVRATEPIAQYVYEIAAQRADDNVSYELIDLKDFDVPLLTSEVHPMAANRQYDDANVQRWSDAIGACDAFVFVTPEYNHGVPGAFKNAVDVLGSEWVGKPVSFVGHGSVGGVRAVEQWRQILSNFSMPLVRAELNFNSFFHMKDGVFSPEPRHAGEVEAMLKQLEGLV
ncbi:MAG: NAD(P)H-dependent oxidoreductase [Leucobacter sp.]|jgi:NAD(P)H-dependent FMN reductase|nr:NAD(P)H-dependent oxidoreductase [Leucobacter sp.]